MSLNAIYVQPDVSNLFILDDQPCNVIKMGTSVIFQVSSRDVGMLGMLNVASNVC